MTSPSFAVLDQHFDPANNLASFAYTNALLNTLPTITTPVLHFWTLDDTLILGLKDQRLPYLDTALGYLRHQQAHYFVRNSGGLAVVSDAGILNVSLFLPATSDTLSVDAGYQQMTDLVTAAFPSLSIEAMEVPHSYCPGKFDLAVNGVKIGGMSQRRNPHGTVIMLYLSINGDQNARAQLVRAFYDHGLAGTPNKWGFPDVQSASMTTISALLPTPITLPAAKTLITQTYTHQANRSAQSLADHLHTTAFQEQLQHELAHMQQRQTKLPHPKEAF